MDEQRNVCILDRSKDMITSGGEIYLLWQKRASSGNKYEMLTACHWSEVGQGQRVEYNPPWMREASDVHGSFLPPPPDFASHSPFGGPSWFARTVDRDFE